MTSGNTRDSVYDLIVIGAGPAGLSAAIEAERLGASVLLLEGAEAPGGLTRSFQEDGYTFDCSGHLLHLSDPEAVRLIERATSAEDWNRLARDSAILIGETLVPYPFQLHLAHTPENVRRECLEGLPEHRAEPSADGAQAGFGRWIEANLGPGIGRHFMVPYNEKLSTVGVDELTCEWLGRFVPQPSLDEIRQGAESRRVVQSGYNRTFLYPARGGIAMMANGLAKLVTDLLTGAKVTEIDTRERSVSTQDGRTFGYAQGIVATNPLPHLAAMVRPSEEGLSVRDRLRANVVTCVNVGLEEADPRFSRHQWIYLPDRKYSAYRIGFYGRFASEMAPESREGVYVEVAHRHELGEDEVVEWALEDLLSVGVIENTASVETVFPVRIENAYVIHDTWTAPTRKTLHGILAERDVAVAGRYARWEYSAMENALVTGMRAARDLLRVAHDGARA